MKILLVAATSAEIESVTQQFFSDSGRGFSCDLNFLITGVGMVNTAYELTKTLCVVKPDFCIQAGIAGSFNNKYKIGDVVNVREDFFSELGAESGDDFISASDLGLMSGVGVANDFSDSVLYDGFKFLPEVRGVTVNTVHGNEKSIQNILIRLNPDVESMEGAAFLQICHREKVKCVQIRSISNVVERRKKENWNIPLAVKNLNDYLIHFLSEIR